MRWDLFCRVVDNWGDAGVCWRLAADLAARGEHVRLWIDDAAPLAWMAPQRAAGVEVVEWQADAPDLEPGDVAIEAFGCDPPPRFVERIARMARPALWLDLEYLSAEPYAEASHGLPSPQQARPGRGLTKWFFFPGFGDRSGGLMREPGLLAARAAFERDAWLATQRWARAPDERVVVLFCYDNPRLAELLDLLARSPTLLLVAAGAAARQAAPLLDAHGRRGALRAHLLPPLPQPQFDRLLWCGDLDFVRGEDSLVRAIWAGAPLVWHIYPQHDGVHARKLDALLERSGASAEACALARRWNGLDAGALELPELPAWRADAAHFRDILALQPDLTTRLLGFVAARR